MNWSLIAVSALAVALAWPLPLWLSRAAWTRRSPRAALVLWQAIALGGALALVAALLDAGLPSGVSIHDLAAATWTGPLPATWSLLNALAFGTATLFVVLLFANLVHTAWVTERRRRQHHTRVALLTQPIDGARDLRLLEHPAPLAFCVPGVRTVTVLSRGALDLFQPSEYAAVIAHERAHLRGQHHLMLLAFRAWHDTLPWFPIASRSEQAVSELLELVADDEAVRATNREALAGALRRVGDNWDDDLSMGQTTGFVPAARVTPRLARLESPEHRISRPARWLVLAAAMLIVAIPASSLAVTISAAWAGA